MQQFAAVWHALDPRRRLIIGAATLAMFALVLGMASMASKPSMSLLYAGLEGARAGDVVTALEQRGVLYEVRGDAIYVEAPQRDELRMSLAAEGLPAADGAGYELLDSLSGFGTTSQMFDAAYWRAKEGELARTIVSGPMIKSARVHIATPSGQPFRSGTRPTASVTVTTNSGGLSPTHAKALKFLVASAVAGMTPEDVSVIDSAGGLIATGDETPSGANAEDRAGAIKRNVERLLEARVGYGNAVVEVALEVVTEREAITERRFDPENRVAISVDTEETSNSANDTKPGAVTVASNLPEGDGASGGKSQSQSSQTRERTNFEVSETTREVLRTPGAVKRLTVAVLVDGVQTTDANGATTWQERPAEELEALRELVASAVGFDEARGDVITLRSMPFEPVSQSGQEVATSLIGGMAFDLMSLIQLAVLAVVVLVLGLFVLRPILTQSAALPRYPEPPGLPGPAVPATPGLSGEIEDDAIPPGNMTLVSDFDMGDLQMPMAMGSGFADEGAQDPVSRLKRLIEERQTETVEILRSWMEDEEERA